MRATVRTIAHLPMGFRILKWRLTVMAIQGHWFRVGDCARSVETHRLIFHFAAIFSAICFCSVFRKHRGRFFLQYKSTHAVQLPCPLFRHPAQKGRCGWTLRVAWKVAVGRVSPTVENGEHNQKAPEDVTLQKKSSRVINAHKEKPKKNNCAGLAGHRR